SDKAHCIQARLDTRRFSYMSERLFEVVHLGYRALGRVLVHPAPSAPAVLLVGGAMQRKEGWGRLEGLLRRESTVVTVDLPGWGGGRGRPAQVDGGVLAAAPAAAGRAPPVGPGARVCGCHRRAVRVPLRR